MPFFRKLFGQTAVYGLSTIVGRLLNYLLVPLYLRILNPGEYGVVVDFYAYAAFGGIVFLYGMETAFFRFAKGNKTAAVYSQIFSAVLVSSLALGSLFFLFRYGVADAAGYSDHPEYVSLFAGILVLDAISAIPFARLRQQNKSFSFAAIKLFNISVNIGLNLFFLLILEGDAKGGLFEELRTLFHGTELPAYIFISNFIANLLSSLVLVPVWPKSFAFPHRGFLKELLSYSLPLMIVGLSGMVNEVIDRILLKELLPLELDEAQKEVGIYGAVYKIATLMTILTQTFRMGAEPFFFEQAENRNSKIIYARLMEYFVAVGTLFYVVVMVFLDSPIETFKPYTISRWMIGTNFMEYYQGLLIVPVLFMANIFFGIYYNLSVWYKLSDKTRFAAMISLGGAAITIMGNIVTIPRFGYVGSAWTTLTCFFLMVVASYLLGRKHFPIPYRIWKIAVLLCLGVLFVQSEEWLLGVLELNSVSGIMAVKLAGISLFALIAGMIFKLHKVVILPQAEKT